ncbi:MAG: ATP-grasp domain-containing protein [Polyangiaceae bacterium]|nr:ATP-grasp domain-containing protein [Polyangiaceae bacterium]
MTSTSQDLFLLQNAVWVLTSRTDNPGYDFEFDRFFECRRPWEHPPAQNVVARIGPIGDYPAQYNELHAAGITLINTPHDHERASELSSWYPLLSDLTPQTVVYAAPPPAAEVEAKFGWPVFVKGVRQTARHAAALSVARSAREYEALARAYSENPILHWQPCAVRAFVDLERVGRSDGVHLPPAFEFRTFWSKSNLLGAGRYWTEASYAWTDLEKAQALAVARQAAERLTVPFLVIDMARTAAGKWIVIECNDGQESGYAGVSPFEVWSNLCELSHEYTQT